MPFDFGYCSFAAILMICRFHRFFVNCTDVVQVLSLSSNSENVSAALSGSLFAALKSPISSKFLFANYLDFASIIPNFVFSTIACLAFCWHCVQVGRLWFVFWFSNDFCSRTTFSIGRDFWSFRFFLLMLVSVFAFSKGHAFSFLHW